MGVDALLGRVPGGASLALLELGVAEPTLGGIPQLAHGILFVLGERVPSRESGSALGPGFSPAADASGPPPTHP